MALFRKTFGLTSSAVALIARVPARHSNGGFSKDGIGVSDDGLIFVKGYWLKQALQCAGPLLTFNNESSDRNSIAYHSLPYYIVINVFCNSSLNLIH